MIALLRALFAPRAVRSAEEAEAERRADERRQAAAQEERRRQVAAQDRAEREAEAARLAAERQEASAATIRAHVERYGFWFPSDGRPAPSRLSGRSRLGRVVEALFGSWR